MGLFSFIQQTSTVLAGTAAATNDSGSIREHVFSSVPKAIRSSEEGNCSLTELYFISTKIIGSLGDAEGDPPEKICSGGLPERGSCFPMTVSR